MEQMQILMVFDGFESQEDVVAPFCVEPELKERGKVAAPKNWCHSALVPMKLEHWPVRSLHMRMQSKLCSLSFHDIFLRSCFSISETDYLCSIGRQGC